MRNQKKSLNQYTIEELDRELIARGAQIAGHKGFQFQDIEGTPQREYVMEKIKELYDSDITPSPDDALCNIKTSKLVELLIIKSRTTKGAKAIWGTDDRMDFYEIRDKQIKHNANCVAAICLKKNLINDQNGYSALNVKNYGDTFNLHKNESFRSQPIFNGWLCTGFLVKEDVIATAGHCADENNVKDLCIIFGFKMLAPYRPATQFSNEDIYNGVEIIGRVYNPSKGEDWALVKLDRKVKGHSPVKLSEKTICHNQQVYILGHPCGLPLKYAAGAQVRDIHESFFSADLNIYNGNSGSPVFYKYSHEIVGLVIQGDYRDFRWTGKGWLSIIYPHPDFHSKEPQCTRVSQFIDYCR